MSLTQHLDAQIERLRTGDPESVGSCDYLVSAVLAHHDTYHDRPALLCYEPCQQARRML